MLYYDKIDTSEGIDINKANDSHEWSVCHHSYYLIKIFVF